jgi:hypothetical protein
MVVKKQMRVDLTGAELHICRILGIMRRNTARKDVEDKQMGDQSPWDIDMHGMIGEYCVAKLLNVCPDLTVSIRRGGKDLETFNGRSIDVKATTYKTGSLLVTLKKKEDPCDIYVLVVVDDDGGDVVGWAKKEDIFLDENKTNKGHGVGYGLTQYQLNNNFEQLANQ